MLLLCPANNPDIPLSLLLTDINREFTALALDDCLFSLALRLRDSPPVFRLFFVVDAVEDLAILLARLLGDSEALSKCPVLETGISLFNGFYLFVLLWLRKMSRRNCLSGCSYASSEFRVIEVAIVEELCKTVAKGNR
jgi:hypothetical protein